MDSNWVAAIVALSTFLSPVVMALLVNSAARRAKEQDWARQDAVAAQATVAAALLLGEQRKSAEKAEEVATRLSATTTVTNTKLDVIHTLVNSNMTAAMQAEHDATVRELAMMEEVVAVKRHATKEEPSTTALAAIAATKIRIGELKTTLADRLEQSKAVAKG